MKSIIISICFFMVCFIYGASLKAQQPTFTLDVKGDPKILDSLTLILEGGFYFQPDDVHNTFLKGKKVKEDCMRFSVFTEDSCGYFSLVKTIADERKKAYDHRIVLYRFFWEKKDDVKMNLSFPHAQMPEYPEITFSGYGAAKYSARMELFKSEIINTYPKADIEKLEISLPNSNELKKMDQFINNYSASMSKLSKEVLKTDYLFKFNLIKAISEINGKIKGPEQRKKLWTDHNNIIALYENSQISEKALAISIFYKRNYLSALMSNTQLKYGRNQPGMVLNGISNIKDQLLRDRLYATYVILNTFDEHFPGKYNAIMATLKDKGSIKVFEEMSVRQQNLYNKNYDFVDYNGIPINLTRFKGKIVLLDLWFSGCGGCASLYKKTLSKIEAQFKNQDDFVVISINVDKKEKIWKDAVKSNQYSSLDGAINLNVGAAGMSHPLIYDWGLQGMPTIVLINKEGGIEFFNTTNLYDPQLLAQSILALLSRDTKV